MTRLTCLLALVALQACARDVGVRVEDFRPASHPAGVHVTLRLNPGLVPGNKLAGELLAADAADATLLLDRPLETPEGMHSVVRTPWWMLRSIELAQLGRSVVHSDGSEQDAEKIARLGRLSRYPQGLDEPLAARLLAAYGVAAVYVPGAAATEQ